MDTSSPDDVIPETQQTETQQTDIFNVTLASDDDPSDESSLLLADNNGPNTTSPFIFSVDQRIHYPLSITKGFGGKT